MKCPYSHSELKIYDPFECSGLDKTLFENSDVAELSINSTAYCCPKCKQIYFQCLYCGNPIIPNNRKKLEEGKVVHKGRCP